MLYIIWAEAKTEPVAVDTKSLTIVTPGPSQELGFSKLQYVTKPLVRMPGFWLEYNIGQFILVLCAPYGSNAITSEGL